MEVDINKIENRLLEEDDRIESYLKGQMSGEEDQAFLRELEEKPEMKELYETIIRGGTDGARLAETGVPCPNIFTGGHNFHSLEEWVPVDSMNSAVNLLLSIVKWWAK